MKNTILLAAFVFINGICFNICAQSAMPPGSSDKNLENRDVKGRSDELERVRQDTDKTSAESKFSEIKEDFEKMQTANEALNNSAQAKEVNYKLIHDSSAEIKKRAVRLKANLFSGAKFKKDSKNKNKPDEAALPEDLNSIIKLINSAIFEFTHSPIFQTAKAFDSNDSAKASDALEKIINLSSAIEKQSKKAKQTLSK